MKPWLFAIVLALSSPAAADSDLLRQLYGQGEQVTPKSASAPAELALHLKENTSVQGERVYVQDLVQCSGPESVCRDIGVVEVGAAPRAGRQERWPKERISMLLADEFPQHGISWSGATSIQIAANTVPVQEEAVRKALEKLLSTTEGPVRLRIQGLRVPTMLQLRHLDYEYSFPQFQDDIAKVLENPRRRFSQFRVLARDTHLDAPVNYEMTIQVTFIAEVQAIVAKTSKVRAQQLTQDDIEKKWVPFQEQIVTDARDAIGKLVRTRLNAHQPIRSLDLVSEPDVQRGERVQAVVIGNGVKMSGVGQAMEAGSIGQKVRIRLDATKRNVVGTVIARSQVEVHMP